MATYQLFYWDARGRGETLRILLELAGVEFEDKRIPIGGEEWLINKYDQPFGQIPTLTNKVTGFQLSQTLAIGHYLARKHGFAPSSLEDDALVESIAHKIEEVGDEIIKAIVLEKHEEVKKVRTERLLNDLLPSTMKFLEKFANKNAKNGYFIGKTITLADIHFFAVCERFLGMMPDYLDAYPHLKALNQKVKSQPKIAQWLEKRPKTEL